MQFVHGRCCRDTNDGEGSHRQWIPDIQMNRAVDQYSQHTIFGNMPNLPNHMVKEFQLIDFEPWQKEFKNRENKSRCVFGRKRLCGKYELGGEHGKHWQPVMDNSDGL